MADIVYRFPEMDTAAVDVDDYAEQYRKAADTLKESILTAISNWEGDSRDKFVSFLEGAVYEYTHDSIPKLVEVISAEIRNSSTNMSNTDAELASNIPQSLG